MMNLTGVKFRRWIFLTWVKLMVWIKITMVALEETYLNLPILSQFNQYFIFLVLINLLMISYIIILLIFL